MAINTVVGGQPAGLAHVLDSDLRTMEVPLKWNGYKAPLEWH